MFLGMDNRAWTMIGASIGIAFLSAMIGDVLSIKKESRETRFRAEKYEAIILCTFLAIAATVFSKFQQYIGAPMAALIFGVILVNVAPPERFSPGFRAGTAYAGKKYLSMGSVCLGATLSLTDLSQSAFALPLILFNMLLAFLISNLLGKKIFHVSQNTCTLVGSGTCVCGGTAIATMSPVIKATEEETAYAMTAIFLFDLLSCLSYPYLGIQLGLDQIQFGFLAGTAINDTSSVVAAQETFAALANLKQYSLPATIKVTRTTMILVLVIIFSFLSIERGENQDVSFAKTIWHSVPKFLLLFVAAVTLNTIFSNTLIRDSIFYQQAFRPFFSSGYKFFVTMALAGVGFKIKFKDLFVNGIRPIVLGGCTWFALFLSSLTFAMCFADYLPN